MRDSNSRHLRCKRSALPTELITRDAAFSQACGRAQEGLEDFLVFLDQQPTNVASYERSTEHTCTQDTPQAKECATQFQADRQQMSR